MHLKLQSNIWKMYLFSFLDMFSLHLPFLIYYYQTLGFSLTQIALLQSAMAITLFISEIPSGYFADRFGRKTSIILSVFLQVLSILILFFATNFFHLILSHIIGGLSVAFLSGADSALLYDTLLSLKQKKEYKKIDGKVKGIGEIAIILAGISGSVLIFLGIKFNILLTLIGHIILLLLAFTLKEPKQKTILEKLPFKKEIRHLFHIIKKSIHNKKLLGIFLYSLIVLGVSNTIFLMYQPYFSATGINVRVFGIIFAGFSIVTAIGAFKADFFEKKLGLFGALFLMPLLLVFSLLGAGIFFIVFGFLFFLFREMVRGLIYPILNDYTNKITKSSERATVLSISSMFARIGLVIISTTFGFFSDSFGLRYVYVVSGVCLLVFILLISPLLKKNL